MIENLSITNPGVVVEEGFVVEVQSFLQELMDEKNVSRSELARRMGVSRGRITQIFSDECTNLTIRLLARAVHALGEVPAIDCSLTRRKRAAREERDRSRLVESAGNVFSIWKDLSANDNPVLESGKGPDRRLEAVLEIHRKRAA
jgi:transcriptional regulator with XRE-family HTH domain